MTTDMKVIISGLLAHHCVVEALRKVSEANLNEIQRLSEGHIRINNLKVKGSEVAVTWQVQ